MCLQDTRSSQHTSPARTFPAHHRLVRLHLPPGRQFPPASAPVLLGLPWSFPPEMQETQVRSLRQEDPLEKDMATHPSILSWEIPWTEEPGGL